VRIDFSDDYVDIATAGYDLSLRAGQPARVAYSVAQASGQWVFRDQKGGQRSVHPGKVGFLANSREAMREAVPSGLGIGLLASFFIGNDHVSALLRR